jgi:hypothetical protein
MLRHKSMIQCARLAFGFTGIYEPDEAERILESTSKTTVKSTPKKVDLETGEITEIVFDITDALDAIEACTDSDSWNAVYHAQMKKAIAVKDTSGIKVLKAAAAEKKAQLIAAANEASNVTDVEAK